MIIQYPAGVRRDWFDRNPVLSINSLSGTGIPPHAITQRLEYTVPANKRANIESIDLFLIRMTVAAPIGKWGVQLAFRDTGGFEYIMGVDWSMSNTVGGVAKIQLTQVGFLNAGEKIRLYTKDLSTGGTLDYDVGYAVVEFDA